MHEVLDGEAPLLDGGVGLGVKFSTYIFQYFTEILIEKREREFLVIQWLGLHSTAGVTGSILAQVTKIPQAIRCGQITKTKLSGLQYQVADIAYLPG